jgi:lipoate-protein ligase A
MKWRVISLGECDAFMNMGIDEALCSSVKEGCAPPTIRFYRWSPDAVSIGRFQSMEGEVDVTLCNGLGVDCVRRITGGGAVYHGNAGEITYSVIAPESCFSRGIRESYREICAGIIRGLSIMGIPAEFAPINDITVNGRKISGNAQTRRGGVLLQHGTILYSLDLKRMFALLKVSPEKISDKMIKSAEERVTCVAAHSNASLNDLYSALFDGFTEGLDFEVDTITPSEMQDAKSLSIKYKSSEWNMGR